ncbi:SRPBCC family protein [Tomitella cavernea]|uniref:SRPBCC family protein n=1 Tax=Tomitella cavernea TaxID=1387982 RepID=A0ABP9CR38_9ACTN|nr:SRPBCC family protein [Tomitella cavernea]
MITMHRTVSTRTAPKAVFDYLADFTTTTEWEPGTVTTVLLDGDGGVGTRYANTSRFAGRTSKLVYTVVAITPGRLIALRGENAAVTAYDTITVCADGAGSQVQYKVEFAFHGALRWIEILLRPAVASLLAKGARGLREKLEAL